MDYEVEKWSCAAVVVVVAFGHVNVHSLLSEGGCSLTCRIMTLAKGAVALLNISEGGCSLSSRITTLVKRAWCSDGTTCILHLLSRCCCIVFTLLSEVLLMDCCRKLCEVRLLMYCCWFMLLNSFNELYAYYYWTWNLTPFVWMFPLRG